MTMQGRTVFITGGSRGIGRAIALKAAQAGANVVIAAKTAVETAKLSGTIYSVAEEIESAGGQALPLVLDVRDEQQVHAAIQQAATTFGGIDVLINNAGAIALTGVEATSLKQYDLIQTINHRATFMCAQAALPFLRQSENPHILSLSPPVNMSPKWLGMLSPYALSKYGMTILTLGMAEEFQKHIFEAFERERTSTITHIEGSGIGIWRRDTRCTQPQCHPPTQAHTDSTDSKRAERSASRQLWITGSSSPASTWSRLYALNPVR